MAIFSRAALAAGLFASALVIFSEHLSFVSAYEPYAVTSWTASDATFYGGNSGAGTMGGACGYGNMYNTGYGLNTAALSPVLFNNGLSCGACFELKCNLTGTKWCYPSAGSITVTATNLCPANPARTTDGWCNPPRTHFDLSYTMFAILAQPVAGIIPIQYRRVSCVKTGGVRFVINGNPWFNLVLIYNVGGDGNVVTAMMKGENTEWYSMTRNWGQNWQLSQKLHGQALSFQLTTGYGTTLVCSDVAPANWQFGQTFEAYTNMYDLY
ncbi:expansin [Marchantia polymorpha subsp. ruderalis]|uniref:Expansin n=2 Tax=Marchantia polymorpha TaxID=3197 RepID=A0AAF6AZ53_MARPO|nr:hypothetical protein MARPO_0085s0051 [Marchantia polymorpha]BBN05037.1 hypothetical protein Mp_3g09770 [Marchantia polymorpha subsp. ruderalis]|eukprot:PTQ33838.1 hypothetical protein MARPO_0085s0051 [Marchantia polymorpha]